MGVAVIDRELFVESVQGTLIIVDGDSVQFMNDVIAIFTISGNPDDATWLCVGGGHAYSVPVFVRREQNVGSLSRRRLMRDVADA